MVSRVRVVRYDVFSLYSLKKKIILVKSEESEGRLQPMIFEALRTTVSILVLS